MKWNEEDRSMDRYVATCHTLNITITIRILKDGAEPKKKRERSAKPSFGGSIPSRASTHVTMEYLSPVALTGTR
jgi:hypothetical protein